MRVGVPRETKVAENRVGLVPEGAATLCAAGHEVAVEAGAGEGSGFSDDRYAAAGARLVDREEAWSAELVVKVKEPSMEEVALLRRGAVLFTYLHLAANPQLTRKLLEAEVAAIAYETVRDPDGTFPVLAPMSEVAGRLAAQIGVSLLQRDHGGKGLLLGGVPGVARGRVCVIGGGTVGVNAARVAHALGAEVDVLDINLRRLTYLYDIFGGDLNTLYANRANLERSVAESDLVIGAVYLAGRKAPTLVTEAMVAGMEAGSVIADVAVDQGGCVETIHPHHPRRPHLSGARRDPLRGGQHAGSGAAHLHLRTHQHHAALRGEPGGARARRRPWRPTRRWPRAATCGAGRWCTRAWRPRWGCPSPGSPSWWTAGRASRPT